MKKLSFLLSMLIIVSLLASCGENESSKEKENSSNEITISKTTIEESSEYSEILDSSENSEAGIISDIPNKEKLVEMYLPYKGHLVGEFIEKIFSSKDGFGMTLNGVYDEEMFTQFFDFEFYFNDYDCFLKFETVYDSFYSKSKIYKNGKEYILDNVSKTFVENEDFSFDDVSFKDSFEKEVDGEKYIVEKYSDSNKSFLLEPYGEKNAEETYYYFKNGELCFLEIGSVRLYVEYLDSIPKGIFEIPEDYVFAS